MSDKRMTLPISIFKVNLRCCDACPVKLKKKLQKIKGVYGIEIDTEKGLLLVSGSAETSTIVKAMEKVGKKAKLLAHEKDDIKKLENHFRKPQNDVAAKTSCTYKGEKKIKPNRPQAVQFCSHIDSSDDSDCDHVDHDHDHVDHDHDHDGEFANRGVSEARRMIRNEHPPQETIYPHPTGETLRCGLGLGFSGPYFGERPIGPNFRGPPGFYLRPPPPGPPPPLLPLPPTPTYVLGGVPMRGAPPPPLYPYYVYERPQRPAGNSIFHSFNDENVSACSVM